MSAMPIDLTQIGALRPETRAMQPLFGGIALRLIELMGLAADSERRLADVPALRYSGDALALTLHPDHAGALVPPPPESGGVAGTLLGAGERFISGFRWIGTAVKSEFILPNALSAIAGALNGVEDSIARFRTPTVAMFGRRAGRATDLAGLTFLGLRAFGASTGTLRAGLDGATALQDSWAKLRGPQGPAKPFDVVGTVRGIVDPMLEIAVGLPLLTASLMSAVPAGGRAVKEALLTELAKLEAKVDDAAAAIVGAIPRAIAGQGRLGRLLEHIGNLIASDATLVANFAQGVAKAVTGIIRHALGRVTDWGRYTATLFAKVPGAIDLVLDVDLLGPALRVHIPGLLVAPLPAVTLRSLVGGASAATRAALILALQSLAAELLIPSLQKRVLGVARLLDLALTPAPAAASRPSCHRPRRARRTSPRRCSAAAGERRSSSSAAASPTGCDS